MPAGEQARHVSGSTIYLVGPAVNEHDHEDFDFVPAVASERRGPGLLRVDASAAGERRDVALVLPTVEVVDQSVRPTAYSDVGSADRALAAAV